MTNEELVQKIKSGENDLLAELWEHVRWFITKRAYSFANYSDGTGKVEMEDLVQSGYFALLEAVEKYDSKAGCSFVGYLRFYLRKQFRKEAGILSSRRDVLTVASSLDEPLSKEGEKTEATLHDITPLPSAEYEFDDMIEHFGNQQVVGRVLECMQKLQPVEREVLLQVCVNELQHKEVAKQLGVSDSRVQQIKEKALRHLIAMKEIRKIKDDLNLDSRTQFHMHKGYRSFNSSFSSIVEDLVLKREQERDKKEAMLMRAI